MVYDTLRLITLLIKRRVAHPGSSGVREQIDFVSPLCTINKYNYTKTKSKLTLINPYISFLNQ